MTESVTGAAQPRRFPLLFAAQRWDSGYASATFSTEPPPDELVTNVHLVGFVGERVVVCRDERGAWFLPGGTLDEEESVEDCVARELREEAGASLSGPLRWIGGHRCVSSRPHPYRPYQPHPERALLWYVTDVVIDAAPTNPDDGEKVVEVRAAAVGEVRRLLETNEPWYPELIDLAVEIRSTGA